MINNYIWDRENRIFQFSTRNIRVKQNFGIFLDAECAEKLKNGVVAEDRGVNYVRSNIESNKRLVLTKQPPYLIFSFPTSVASLRAQVFFQSQMIPVPYEDIFS